MSGTEADYEHIGAEAWSHDDSLISTLTVKFSLARLSADHRDVLGLVDVSGFSYLEAADILGVPAGTVTSRVARARTALLKQLEAGNIVKLPVGKNTANRKMNDLVTEELLNAYVDGELSPDDDARVAQAIARDPGLAARVATLSRVKSALSGLAAEPANRSICPADTGRRRCWRCRVGGAVRGCHVGHGDRLPALRRRAEPLVSGGRDSPCRMGYRTSAPDARRSTPICIWPAWTG